MNAVIYVINDSNLYHCCLPVWLLFFPMLGNDNDDDDDDEEDVDRAVLRQRVALSVVPLIFEDGRSGCGEVLERLYESVAELVEPPSLRVIPTVMVAKLLFLEISTPPPH